MVVFGMFDPSVETPDTAAFLTAYRAKYNEDPNAWAALAYDAGHTLIASASGPVTRESLNSAFSQIKNLKGVTGPTTFQESGDRDGKLYFLKVENGKFQLTSSE
jgi:branched-chain amino acid transport system substrate-binding protein